MKQKVHAIAGITAFLIILTFWTSTVLSEALGTHEHIMSVKSMILRGMVILLPSMIIVGASGMVMGRRRGDAPARAKKKRMPFIAANGLFVLLPAAFFLDARASSGFFRHSLLCGSGDRAAGGGNEPYHDGAEHPGWSQDGPLQKGRAGKARRALTKVNSSAVLMPASNTAVA